MTPSPRRPVRRQGRHHGHYRRDGCRQSAPRDRALAQLASERSQPAVATLLGHNLKAEPMFAALPIPPPVSPWRWTKATLRGWTSGNHSIPGALAVAEEMGVNGKRFIESVVVGYEIESRLGGATSPGQRPLPWALGGRRHGCRHAKLPWLRSRPSAGRHHLAASMSPANTWTTAFRGATSAISTLPDRLPGHPCRPLYDCGFTASTTPPPTFSAPSSAIPSAPRPPSRASAVSCAFSRTIQIPRLLPHKSRLHEAILDAQARNGLDPDTIERIDLRVHRMLDGMLGPYPDNVLASKFHVPYAIAGHPCREQGPTPPSSTPTSSPNPTSRPLLPGKR